MNSGVPKAWARRSRVKLSKSLQEQLLDAVAKKGAEHSPSHREQFPVSGDLDLDAVPVKSTKRQLDTTSGIDLLPAKRARLMRTDTQRSGAEEENTESADKTLRQPKPKPPERAYASFLSDFVDPVHPDRHEPVYTFVSEWLKSFESDQGRHCRSDSHLYRSDDDPISRKITRSAPEMEYTRDADGFVMPPTPASIGSRSYRADADTRSVAPSDITGSTRGSGRLSGRSLVEDPLYREMNLAANNIYLCHPCDPIPEHVASLVNHIRQDRDSPGPSLDQLRQDTHLYDLWMGSGEPAAEKYFQTNIFPDPKSSDSLKRTDRNPMVKRVVPDAGSSLKISTPVPDMIYGYNRQRAFLKAQRTQLISMGTEMVANSQDLIYPFFVIKFKGDGPSGAGSLWVATNQCLGTSASCVNIAERLNYQLKMSKSDKIRPINSTVFSIAMSGTEARLYISWKHDELEYYMASVDNFLLQDPDHYLKFRKYVRNIIDWGKGRRLNEISDSLDSLLEESRKRTSEVSQATV